MKPPRLGREVLKRGALNINELVAPTGFEPVFKLRRVFAKILGVLRQISTTRNPFVLKHSDGLVAIPGSYSTGMK